MAMGIHAGELIKTKLLDETIIMGELARSGRTNTNKDTYFNVKEVPEVVINVVTYAMVHVRLDPLGNKPKTLLIKPLHILESHQLWQ